MMGSLSLMKGAVVVVSAAEPINKKPQLKQHLIASKMANINNLIICFNKLDLISIDVAKERKKELDQLLNELDIKPYIIIPTSFNKNLGLKNLLKAMINVQRMIHSKYNNSINESNSINNTNPFFRITRSFDINKPGTNWNDIKGGVIGGSLIYGELNIGDMVEIKPGLITKSKNGTYIWNSIKTVIKSLETDNNQIDKVFPGGLIGIGTDIDPYYCKNDMLSGNIMGKLDTLPDVYQEIKLKFEKLDDFDGYWEPKKEDIVYLQIGNISVESKLSQINKENFIFTLLKPTCIENNSKILICRKDNGILKIVGYSIF
jgi:translation initiation factor 2 subunit 3